MNHDVSAAITKLYSEINHQTAAFREVTGLYCPPGCGQCCDNPTIEASPLEMVPMALEIIRRGEAPLWLEKIEAVGAGPCVFYQADEQVPGNGRCLMYLWRPTICRLFGYAATLDKTGNSRLAACTRHRQQLTDQVAMAQVAIANGLTVPHFAEWQTRIASLDPHWGNQPMPINLALKLAIERVGMNLAYETQTPPAEVAPSDTSASLNNLSSAIEQHSQQTANPDKPRPHQA